MITIIADKINIDIIMIELKSIKIKLISVLIMN